MKILQPLLTNESWLSTRWSLHFKKINLRAINGKLFIIRNIIKYLNFEVLFPY